MSQQDNHEAVLTSLRHIIHAIDLHSRHLVQDIGITGPQLMVLRTLERLGALPVGTLAREVSLSHATVTGVLDRLERRSLVRRERSAIDRRKVIAALTPAASSILENAPPLLHEHFISQFKQLPSWEQSQILSSVQRLAAMMHPDHIELPDVIEPIPLESGRSSGDAP